MAVELDVTEETWPVKGVFRISRSSRTEMPAVFVELRESGIVGRGECSPTAHYGETLASVVGQIEQLAGAIRDGLDRTALQRCLPPGAARNALDCALWDLEAKRAGDSAWRMAGLVRPEPLTTAYTLSVDTAENMAAMAKTNAARPLLKLKLAGDGEDLARVQAVHINAPEAALIVDANEAWSVATYDALVGDFQKLGVAMIEQPFKANDDAVLAELSRPIPVCADESCHTAEDLSRLAGRYDVVNIKLDKTGGLTEGLALRKAALAQGFELMVGCMVGTSLAMAPALLVAQGARFVDLDGPLLLAGDREPALTYQGSTVNPAAPELWG